MKKNMLLIFICIITLVGCKATNYTSEFPYVPSHPNMEFIEFTYQGEEENDYTTATYKVSDLTQEQVMEEYLKILEEDSWEITFVNMPLLIQASKNENDIHIFSFLEDNDVILAILAR